MGFDPLNFFSQRTLSKSEQIAVDHFKKNPGGRGFFSVAEIMARHQEWDEAIQLLSSGLERHPSYSVARVYLSQLLLKRFHLGEAWDTLENSPLPLRTNLMAQLLRLKLSMLLGKEGDAKELARDLTQQEFQDNEAQVILNHLDFKPFEEARRDFADYLKIPYIDLPQLSKTREASLSVPISEASQGSGLEQKVKSQSDLEAESSFRERIAKGFFATPIHSLFQKPVTHRNAEIDPLTWARLLRRQGLYAKASETYQKLLYETPSNDLLKREYAEICELRDAQKKIDRTISPEVVLSMEKVRKIDDKIRLLNELLNRLEHVQHEFT